MGFKDSIAYGNKDLVLVDKDVINQAGIVIPGPIPDLELIGFAVIGIVLVAAAIANEIVNSEVNLTISTFPQDEGLAIGDEGFVLRPSQAPETELYTDRNGTKDYNYNRVFTLTWKLTDYANNEGLWYIGGQLLSPEELPGNQIALDVLNLTAGQKYYWQGEYVSANTGDRGRFDGGEFIVPQHQPKTNPFKTFSSVTIITPDSNNSAGDLAGVQKSLEIAKGIAHNFESERDNGTILVYNPTDNTWTAPLAEYSSLTNSRPTKFGAPLILIDNWSVNSDAESSGFAEAAADNFFAALASLNQSYTGNVKDALLESPLHFIGHGRGAVVNSEVIQRLGTYFPHAGGVYRDPDTNTVLRGDLQMTTIDVHDFAQFNQVNYFDPQVQVWDNVTFADNYYQTTAADKFEGRKLENNIPPGWLDLNNSISSRADVNVDLSGYAGFTIEDLVNGKDPHHNALAWYAGTADVSLDENNTAFGTRIFRRKGDFSQDVFYDNSTYVPWYTNNLEALDPTSSQLNGVSHGDPDGQWEGVGTGWYYSAIGGGYSRRGSLPVNLTPRTPIKYDNSATIRQRGDYAVPTVFNGNFDVQLRKATEPIPGWLLSSSSPSVSNTQFNLKKWSDILPNTSPDLDVYANNYAIKLNNGDTLTHNLSVVPDWGVLRLDLYAPIDSTSKDNFGSVTVTIEEVGNSSNSQSEIIKLENAKNSTAKSPRTRVDGTTYNANIPSSYEADIYRLGYGVSGFETFHVNVDPSLRGKSVKIKITTDIAATSATNAIYLDNVFFKSEALKWGNPTNARNGIDADPNNYLIEKPQYTLSYNQSKNTINWVAWKVNKSWSGNANRPVFAGFASDPELAANNITPQITDANYESNYLRQIQDGQSIQNWEKDEQGNFVYKGEDPLDTSINIFVLSQDHQRIDSYRENAAGNRTYAKYYQLNPDPTTQGEIYYQDDQGSKYYYKSGNYDPQNPPDSNQILPNKLFDTDRGHLSAVEDRSRSKKDLLATFLTSNLIPQQSNNNQGIWRSLEQYIRKPFTSIPRLDTYLIAGIDDNYDSSSLLPSQKYKGIFDATSPLISLPTHIWKVILTVDRSQSVLPDYESLGVYLNNTNIPGTWNQYAGSIESLQDKISNPNTPGGFSYNFLSNLSEIQASKINGTLKYRPNSAPLLADTTTSLSTSFINEINEPVTKAPVIVETILASSSENAPAESNIQTADINKIDISKVAFDKVNFIQIGVSPDSIGKITSSKPRTASQGAIIINRDTKVTSSKIDITPNEKLQIRLSQIGIADNSSVHFDISQETPFQSNPTEVTSTEIDSFIRSNPDIWKLSLPSSITSQQFLNTELFSQNSNPQVFNIESIAANIWSNPFNSTTSIKFNFAITNLPTGQLAEGTITSYNPNGTPKTATISIDDDANGVGWFIDSTPQDNSEFTGVDNYFQATPNSAASGKYDLLTAILHEMGHTFGIINGYSEFDKHIKNGKFITTDSPTGAKITLTPDGSHLDSTLYPYDLMNTSLKPGIRKLPSALDLSLLNSLWSTE